MTTGTRRSQINLSCPPDLLDELKRTARKRGLTITAFVHEAIRREMLDSSIDDEASPFFAQQLDAFNRRLEAIENLFSKELL